MNENKIDKDQNHSIIKKASFISNNDQNISTNHTFKTIKKRIPWSEEEDKSIKSLVSKYGTSNWTLISNEMGQNRSGKQCRERWHNQLNPNMKKNNWTDEEENILFTKHMQLGNKWSDIASYLPGRTLNDIKNHFYSKLRKFIRKILKQINDENLFKINGIDGCKYNGEKIYKMIKQYEITYKNLTKDSIFEMIIDTEKNQNGKFISFNDNSNNVEYNSYNSNFINNLGNNLIYNDINEEIKINKNEINNKDILKNNLLLNFNNHQQQYEDIKEKINNLDNIAMIKNKNNHTKSKSKTILSNNNNKLKENIKKENINTKENLNSQVIISKSKDKTNINKEKFFKNENINNNKLIGQKRKKSNRKSNNLNNSFYNNKAKCSLDLDKNSNNCYNLLLSDQLSFKKKLKEKDKIKKRKIKKSYKTVINEDEKFENENNDILNSNLNEIKFISKFENKEKDYCFFPPPTSKIETPKTSKNIIFPASETKSNKSFKPEDFSFNKINLLNDYLDSSQIPQILPVNIENILLYPQKNKNMFISDLSFDNLMKSRGSCLGSIKNDNTYKNFSIDGNLCNKMIMQNININNPINNNMMSIKSTDNNNILEEKNEINLNKKIDKPNINLDLINHQDFTNTFINGNIIAGNESQYNSIFNKNNPLNIYNSSPSSLKSIWK